MLTDKKDFGYLERFIADVPRMKQTLIFIGKDYKVSHTEAFKQDKKEFYKILDSIVASVNTYAYYVLPKNGDLGFGDKRLLDLCKEGNKQIFSSLPHGKCILACDTSDPVMTEFSALLVVVTSHPTEPNGVSFIAFTELELGLWMPVYGAGYYIAEDSSVRYHFQQLLTSVRRAPFDDSDTDEDIAKHDWEMGSLVVACIVQFLYALQSKTYEDTIVQPRLSRAAAERRAKRKQPPVIETRVLTLKVPQVVTRSHGAAQGGTHASPREHTRSGHWRHLANGKEVWVRDCIVGSAEKGKIKKIYNVVTG